VAFSPNGHILAAAYLDGTIRLWDITSPADPQPLGQPLASSSSSNVNVLAFSPVGHTLASGNEGGAVELWDVANPAQPQPLGQLMTGSSVDAVAFSADGRSLASGTDDGITRLWTMNVDDVIQRICLTAGGLTQQQWHDYILHLPYQRLCSSSGDPAPEPRR